MIILIYFLFLMKNINIMDLQTVSTCVNCENLSKNFVCGKHNLNVGLYNVCESHTKTNALTKNSNCLNCSHYGGTSCTHPKDASEGMLCFDWELTNNN